MRLSDADRKGEGAKAAQRKDASEEHRPDKPAVAVPLVPTYLASEYGSSREPEGMPTKTRLRSSSTRVSCD